MKLPVWLGKGPEDMIEMTIGPANVMVALIASQSHPPSLATVLTSEQIKGLSENAETKEKWLSSIPIKLNPESELRLIGNQSEFSTIQAFFSHFNLKPGKNVSIEESRTFYFFPKEGRIRALKAENSTALERKTRVMVVDDSETIRKLLAKMMNEDPQIECVATIDSPNKVLAAIERYRPDVITMDIHMPEMDGVTLLKKVLAVNPIPVVMVSALSKEDGTYVLDALESGAVDYIQKPSLSEAKSFAPVICEKIKNARFANVQKRSVKVSHPKEVVSTLRSQDTDLSYLIGIGSSTGGTEALRVVLTQLPEKIPPILIVQHIPPVFSKAFADRMNQLCQFNVKEAEDGDVVENGNVYIAPGGKQMSVKIVSNLLKIKIEDSPPVNRHKPSVDVLFDSIAALNRKKVVATILTGMGSDGAKGLLKLKQGGAQTFAQDEASCVVFGMPKEALKLGGANEAVPLDQMALKLLSACRMHKKGNAA